MNKEIASYETTQPLLVAPRVNLAYAEEKQPLKDDQKVDPGLNLCHKDTSETLATRSVTKLYRTAQHATDKRPRKLKHRMSYQRADNATATTRGF